MKTLVMEVEQSRRKGKNGADKRQKDENGVDDEDDGEEKGKEKYERRNERIKAKKINENAKNIIYACYSEVCLRFMWCIICSQEDKLYKMAVWGRTKLVTV